jgi:hypothetical protein
MGLPPSCGISATSCSRGRLPLGASARWGKTRVQGSAGHRRTQAGKPAAPRLPQAGSSRQQQAAGRRAAVIGRLRACACPPTIIILGTIVFHTLGKPNSPSHVAAAAEQCGRPRFPKAMREPPLLGHPPQKSQYRGAATPQALLGGIFGRYTPKRNGYICSPPPGHCTGAV